MTGGRLTFARSMAAVAIALVVVGCGFGPVSRAPVLPDGLAGWSETPLPPDPKLAALVLGGQSACGAGDDEGPIQILVQDRRTVSTAAFLFSGATTFGSCLLTTGESSGGSGPLPDAMTTAISIDDQGSGTVGDKNVAELGGRVAPAAAQVVVELADGRRVLASLANGWWLAWWPGATEAKRVVATDGAGAEIASTNVVNTGGGK